MIQVVTMLHEGGRGELQAQTMQEKQDSCLLQPRRRRSWQQQLLISSELWVAVWEAQPSMRSSTAEQSWQGKWVYTQISMARNEKESLQGIAQLSACRC